MGALPRRPENGGSLDLRLFIRRGLKKLHQDGPKAAFMRAAFYLKPSHATEEQFDASHGTDTGGFEALWNFRVSSPNKRYGQFYQATRSDELIAAIKFLGVHVSTFTFIDIGAGKGRMLIIASELGFERIVGVELVPELADIAKKNLAKLGIKNAEVESADAADFLFPHSDLVVYFYNPFTWEVMQKVVANLRNHTRELYVIYKFPKCAALFDSFMEGLGCPPGVPDIQVWKATNK